MNWYYLVKLSAIWDVQYYDDSIISLLEALYELTYKYQRLESQKFRGHSRRYDNILLKLEREARDVIQKITSILSYVFEEWLRGHALLNPRQWSAHRVKQTFENNGNSPEEVASAIEREIHWVGENQQKYMPVSYPGIESSLNLLDAPVSDGRASYLSAFFESKKDVMYKEQLQDNLAYNEESDYPKTNEYVEKETKYYFDNLTFSEFISDNYRNDINDLLDDMQEYYDIYEVSLELYEFLCFPVWYGFWQQMGIDETRKRIENAYRTIGQIENQQIKQALASINFVINIAHQTGEMSMYIANHTEESEQDILRTMERLSNSVFPEWDYELKEIGSVFDQQENDQINTQKNQNINSKETSNVKN